MAADWLGSLVSINCGPTLGVYQGEVVSVDQSSQTISLRQPFHNGVKCPVPEVTFSAIDIKELKILDITIGNARNSSSASTKVSSAPVAVPKGDPRSAANLNSPQHCSKSQGERHVDIPGQPKGFRRRHNSWSSSSKGANQATPKKNGVKNGQMKPRDDECFGEATDGLDTDFDFEGNLALFDKAAVFSEIDISERRNGARSRGTPLDQTPTRYRHDENILEAKPVVYRQITVPQPGAKEYCTDSGLVVPSISYELHQRLLSIAERHGLSLERRLEMTGVCATQMALTLLGGPNRFTPKNLHQRPTVALLCGPHVQGAQGISCGRHLANHEVEVVMFLPNFVKMLDCVTSEVTLFNKTSGKQVSSIKEHIPDGPALVRAAADWANQNRAPVLSLDPPGSGQGQAVEAKWSLSLCLPLSLAEGDGRVYLCDIGIPRQVFKEVGIKYICPFGCKFVIPLHSA
ncbi:hypothetical protein F7725_023039 [Dissostichus mawsoni]|uniref:Enhancer of mRNA-decapping protein 3 n=1 Tax=Dissostichus mawsoni TaxID=36200 RepID=A0A7J5YZJ6_DISMA|nr:hypothetical protein F7725_023039 [Dissostichus mawsoni]